MLVNEVFPSAVADNYREAVESRDYTFYLITVEQIDSNCNALGTKKVEESVLEVLDHLIHCGSRPLLLLWLLHSLPAK